LMADYAEERASELEVLHSIYPDELTVLSDDKISLALTPEDLPISGDYKLSLLITYPPEYPEQVPEINVEVQEGDVTDDERDELVRKLDESASESLGMAMVYTLSLALRDHLSDILEARKARIDREEAEAIEREEQEVARKKQGTQVTRESFLKWRDAFEKEEIERRRKTEEERLKALPPKEREELKKWLAKPTGKELFEKDINLADSDAAFANEGGLEIDVRQYEREHVESDSEDEGRPALPAADSDDE